MASLVGVASERLRSCVRFELGKDEAGMTQTARKAFVCTIVVVGVLAFALALWKLKLVVSSSSSAS
jgi:hypothetical protein